MGKVLRLIIERIYSVRVIFWKVSQHEGRRTTKREARRSLNLVTVTNIEDLIKLLDGIALVM